MDGNNALPQPQVCMPEGTKLSRLVLIYSDIYTDNRITSSVRILLQDNALYMYRTIQEVLYCTVLYCKE